MNGAFHDRIPYGHRVHLDTMVFIYFIQQSPAYLPIVKPIIKRVADGSTIAVASCITLLEVLVQPLRENRPDLASRYERMLTASPNLTLAPIHGEIASLGADIRARHDFKAIDAVQIATALHYRAHAFITNDVKLKRCVDLDVIVLDELR